MSYMTASSPKTPFFTLFILSRASDNTTSLNIGADQCMGRPPPQILGGTVPLGLRLWDWLWYPMLWSQRRYMGAHGTEISIQISALAEVEPQTLASNGREHYH